jgi:hypothetical protein
LTTSTDTESSSDEALPAFFTKEESIRSAALHEAVAFWHGTSRNISEVEIIKYAKKFEEYLKGEVSSEG